MNTLPETFDRTRMASTFGAFFLNNPIALLLRHRIPSVAVNKSTDDALDNGFAVGVPLDAMKQGG